MVVDWVSNRSRLSRSDRAAVGPPARLGRRSGAPGGGDWPECDVQWLGSSSRLGEGTGVWSVSTQTQCGTLRKPRLARGDGLGGGAIGADNKLGEAMLWGAST